MVRPAESHPVVNVGDRVDVLVRPHDIVVDPGGSGAALVDRRVFRGAEYLYTLRLESGDELLYYAPDRRTYEVGERIGFRLRSDALSVFSRSRD
jgi:iron(III) transport system ATP-binding protein